MRDAPDRTPIEVLDHQDAWTDRFVTERDRLADTIGQYVLAIEHVGSTSVAGLPAEPVIDLCPVVPDMDAADACRPLVRELGYRTTAERTDWLRCERRDEAGRHYALHFHPRESERLADTLRVRAYLREHRAARRTYAMVKRHAAAAHPHDPEAYDEAKRPVARWLRTAAREADTEPTLRNALADRDERPTIG